MSVTQATTSWILSLCCAAFRMVQLSFVREIVFLAVDRRSRIAPTGNVKVGFKVFSDTLVGYFCINVRFSADLPPLDQFETSTS